VIPLRDANPTRRLPLITILLIVACLVVFAYELGIESEGGQDALYRFFLDHGAVPSRIHAALVSGRGLPSAGADIVTSMFLHGSWLHVLGNMLYLWIFGNNVEDRIGRLVFVPFYLVGGCVAALAQIAIDPTSPVPLVGASGAIAAILGAYVVLFPRARVMSLVFLGFFYQLIEVPALVVLGFWFVLQLIDGLTSLGAPSGSDAGVAFFAHIGGFALGLAAGWLVRMARPRPTVRVG
jgi:membrane associated rhomboid family serine protease